MSGDLRDLVSGSDRTWLVTGAAGFIGSALCETLLGFGQKVIGLDNFATGHQHNVDMVKAGAGDAAANYEFVEGDICDADLTESLCKRADIVLHQAALGSVPRSIDNPLASHHANVTGFITIAVAAARGQVKRFVYASSSSVYGDHPALPKVEENIGKPLSPYAATKFINEVYADNVQRVYGLETIGLRYFNVYGRRQDPNGPYAAVIPRWVELLFTDQPCKIFGDGTQSRDFCHVNNAVQANLRAALAPSEATQRVYNVGCEGNTNLLDLYTALKNAVGRHYAQAASATVIHEEPRAGDVPHSQAAIEAARGALGYEPTVQIDRGLEMTVDWFAAQRNKS